MKQINYSHCSLDEIEDVLTVIDKEQFPENYENALNRYNFLKKDFEEEIKPSFTDDELFRYTAREIGKDAEGSNHAAEYFIFFAIVAFLLFAFKDSVSAIVTIFLFSCISLVFIMKSNAKDKDIFNRYKCPLCHGELHFEKYGGNHTKRWHMNCWSCKKMASTEYSGLYMHSGE